MGKMDSKREVLYVDGEDLEKKATQIAFSIAQANEYFVAADSVSINTSPLLYFYGMLSLAKAIIIANETTVYLSDVQYHGLTSRPKCDVLEQYKQDEAGWNLEEEYAVIQPGVFSWFTQVTMKYEFPQNSFIRIKDIFKIDPELLDYFKDFYQEEPEVQYLYDLKESLDPYKLIICPSTLDRVKFEQQFPEMLSDFILSDETKGGQALVYKSKEHVLGFPKYLGSYHPIAGGRFLVSGLSYSVGNVKNKRFVYPEISDYVLMFILSNCVRYKQEFWGKLIQGELNGVIGLINLSITNIKLRYVRFILNNLFNEEFNYGVAARWM